MTHNVDMYVMAHVCPLLFLSSREGLGRRAFYYLDARRSGPPLAKEYRARFHYGVPYYLLGTDEA